MMTMEQRVSRVMEEAVDIIVRVMIVFLETSRALRAFLAVEAVLDLISITKDSNNAKAGKKR